MEALALAALVGLIVVLRPREGFTDIPKPDENDPNLVAKIRKMCACANVRAYVSILRTF
jgi:hypothetical protein